MTSSGILEKLDTMEKEEGSLPQLLEFYRKLVQVQTRVGRELKKPNPSLSTETTQQRITEGKALVAANEFAFDLHMLQSTFRKITVLFSEYADLFDSPPEEFGKITELVITSDDIKAWYEGRPYRRIKVSVKSS